MNVFKQFFRSFRRNKLVYLINILGFVPALACVLLTSIWIHHEYTVDRVYPNADRILTVHGFHRGEEVFRGAPPLAAPTIAAQHPEVKHYTRILFHAAFVKYNQQKHRISSYDVDPGFFSMFHTQLIAGEELSMKHHQHCVVTEKTAQLLFGDETALGKYLTYDSGEYEIVGVVESLNRQSTVINDSDTEYCVFLPMHRRGGDLEIWYENSFSSYLEMHEPTDPNLFTQKIESLPNKAASNNLYLEARLLQDRNLYHHNNIRQLKIMALVALIVLLIACVNFINFSTATFSKNAFETGLRKILGATRGQLILQTLLQVFVLVTFSTILSLVVAYLFFPVFNQQVGQVLRIEELFQFSTLGISMTIIGVVTLLAGLYPAIFISSFSGSTLQQGRMQHHGRNAFFRKGLVCFQFAISVGMIICSAIVSRQLLFLQQVDYGFSSEQIVCVKLYDQEQQGRAFELKEKLLQEPFVEAASLSTGLPTAIYMNGTGFSWRGNEESSNELISFNLVDVDWADVFRIELADGVFFSEENPGVVINGKLSKMMNLERSVGEFLSSNDGNQVEVVGVLDNFRFNNIKGEQDPCILLPFMEGFMPQVLSVRLNSSDMKADFLRVNKLADSVLGGSAGVEFYDKQLQAKFEFEKRTLSVVSLFSILAIFITAMGIFALTSFTIEQKRREILIRRINGASRRDVFILLLKQYVVPTVFAAVIAFPLAYSIMQDWLTNYMDRYSISPVIFVSAILGLMFLVVLTVLLRSWSILAENPSETLRNG